LKLQQAGYRVRIAASETFADFVSSFGLEFYPLLGDVSKIADDENLRLAMSADNPLKVMMSFKTMKNYAYAMQPGFYAACQGADAII
jgi:sterol 3beta-glucosyltransferase